MIVYMAFIRVRFTLNTLNNSNFASRFAFEKQVYIHDAVQRD